jgi:hypothetical protein
MRSAVTSVCTVRTEVAPISDPLGPLCALPRVADAVQRSRTAVDGLLGNRVLRRRSGDVCRESLLRGSWASARMAGSPATLDDVRNGQAADPVAQGALRVYVELAVLSDRWATAHRQVLARLHALAAADLSVPEMLGRPRPDREVAHRLDLLGEVLTVSTAPAIVTAAIVLGEIMLLDAFAPSSAVVARAAARIVLIQRGLDPKALVVLEVGQLECRAEEGAALLDYATGRPDGVTGWIEHCSRALELGVRESLAICESLQRR